MRVGGEVEGLCRKCGRAWHVVIAVADGRIAQVECQPCGARHRHRPVDGATPSTRSRPAGPARQRRSAPRGPTVDADTSRPVRSFRASDVYRAGDRIHHLRFGDGIVQAVKGVAKIEVWFEDGSRTLVHGRRGPGG